MMKGRSHGPTLTWPTRSSSSGLTAVWAAFRLDFNAREPYARFLRMAKMLAPRLINRRQKPRQRRPRSR